MGIISLVCHLTYLFTIEPVVYIYYMLEYAVRISLWPVMFVLDVDEVNYTKILEFLIIAGQFSIVAGMVGVVVGVMLGKYLAVVARVVYVSGESGEDGAGSHATARGRNVGGGGRGAKVSGEGGGSYATTGGSDVVGSSRALVSGKTGNIGDIGKSDDGCENSTINETQFDSIFDRYLEETKATN